MEFFFTISTTDEQKAICNYCAKEISHGDQDKHGFGHSGLKKHLTHPTINRKYLNEQKSAEKEIFHESDEETSSKINAKLELQKYLDEKVTKVEDPFDCWKIRRNECHLL
uniref:BED-type domain-containing protein n=1 Tax=Romanomermis culicivorax TaxID=13658 RepID=A0A915JEE1_ROMCU